MPEIRADLFLALSKSGMCLLTSLCFKRFTVFWFPAGKGFKKVGFRTFFKSKVKFRMILSKLVIKTLIL